MYHMIALHHCLSVKLDDEVRTSNCSRNSHRWYTSSSLKDGAFAELGLGISFSQLAVVVEIEQCWLMREWLLSDEDSDDEHAGGVAVLVWV